MKSWPDHISAVFQVYVDAPLAIHIIRGSDPDRQQVISVMRALYSR